MRTTDTVVVGAGQAGLAASRLLTGYGRDHVVLERGRVGQRWRAGSWDSLHLLSPNWLNTLPGKTHGWSDPDGFASAREYVDDLSAYACSFAAPVVAHAGVRSVRHRGSRFEVVTPGGTWLAANVIVATGWCDLPAVPGMASQLARGIHQVVPENYRNPRSLPSGGVLVVGASATGVQLADELRSAGRDVTIAVGSHRRLPRSYRVWTSTGGWTGPALCTPQSTSWMTPRRRGPKCPRR